MAILLRSCYAPDTARQTGCPVNPEELAEILAQHFELTKQVIR